MKTRPDPKGSEGKARPGLQGKERATKGAEGGECLMSFLIFKFVDFFLFFFCSFFLFPFFHFVFSFFSFFYLIFSFLS